MARPRKFDEKTTIDAVTQVFWHKGYEATTVNDLIKATGLRPGSLYGAFCNKRQLFLLSLDNYAKDLGIELERFFTADEPAYEKVNGFFTLFTDVCQITPQGCFLVNTLFEANSDDQDILEHVKNLFLKLEQKFATLMLAAQQQGVLNPQMTPAFAAKIIMSAIYGLRGYSKLNNDIESIKMLKQHVIKLLFVNVNETA